MHARSSALSRIGGALAVIAVVAAACGDSGSSPESAAPPDPAVVLPAAGSAMQGLESARFTIELDGAPLVVTAGLGLKALDGQWTAPASAQAIADLGAGDVTVQIGAVSIDGRQWITNPVTGDWEELPSGLGFDPAVLFDRETGWEPLLSEDLSDVAYLGLDGGDYRFRALAAGSRVETITAGLAGAEPVVVEVWVDPATSYVTRVLFSTTGDDGDTEWRIRLSEFNEPVTITPPDTG